MNEVNAVLGDRIKISRKMLDMTRERLAEKIEVTPRFLADVESGKVGVSLTTLKKICIALSVSADYLLGLADAADSQLSDIVKNKVNITDSKYLPAVLTLLDELDKIN